ncbi:hypothetical protein M0R45_020635 [Rubus argutus]|uniref:Retrotransposon Copia-like N-terminal domain-containing protein n=1 Tax=Rubus argutus TaxID=59490 RepID=A0AAW1XCG0_RUBAR
MALPDASAGSLVPPTGPSSSEVPQPQVIHHYHTTTTQDNFTFPTGTALNESNYAIWVPLMRMRIGARGKVEYLTGAKTQPDRTRLGFQGGIRGWPCGAHLRETSTENSA